MVERLQLKALQLNIISSQNHSKKKQMNSASKLPYKVQFEPEYEQYNQRMSRLPVPPVTQGSFQISDQLLQLVDNVREKLRYQDLEFTPSNIYSQYASVSQLKQGKKNAAEYCPSCGEENKKQVQCEFCAVMYCKNCCWRKRVLPHISEPKQSRLQCQECHAKYVKLFANQKFYQQSAIIQKIIDASNSKLKKIEKQVKAKKQKVEISEKKKKECKIKEGILLKQLKNQQKKVQQLQQKLQQVVKAKAQKLRKQQEEKDLQIKKTQEQEQQKIKKQEQRVRRQKEVQETLRRQKQIQDEQQRIKIMHEQTERRIKEQAQLQKKKQKQLEEKRKFQEEEKKKNEAIKLRRLLSDQKHKHDTDELRNLAINMTKDHEIHQPEAEIEGPPIVMAITKQPTKDQKEVTNFVVTSSPIQKIEQSPPPVHTTVNSSFQDNSSPVKVLSSFNLPTESAEANSKNSMASSKSNESGAKIVNQKSQKTELTQSSDKGADNNQQTGKKDENQEKGFEALPPIAINVSQMTVNQLLGIHVNPNANAGFNPGRRMSQRESYLKQDKKNAQAKKDTVYQVQTPEAHPEVNQITEEQKYEILRSSSMSASLLHSKNQQQQVYEHPDPAGGKCNCSLM